ncbi:MAG: hypothetical protein Q7R93_02585 [bacterium]|nr:hypothetical protein [bacterium]
MNEPLLLFTGFEPFGPYPANISELLGKRLDGKIVAGYRIRTVILPATISADNRGEQLLDLAHRESAVGILSMGMWSVAREFRIETVARNCMPWNKYCPAFANTLISSRYGADERFYPPLAPWKLPAFKAACRARARMLPVEISGDAGSFCCEHLMVQVEIAQRERRCLRRLPFLFIHLPCCPEAISENERDAFTAAGKIFVTVDEVAEGFELLLQGATL